MEDWIARRRTVSRRRSANVKGVYDASVMVNVTHGAVATGGVRRPPGLGWLSESYVPYIFKQPQPLGGLLGTYLYGGEVGPIRTADRHVKTYAQGWGNRLLTQHYPSDASFCVLCAIFL